MHAPSTFLAVFSVRSTDETAYAEAVFILSSFPLSLSLFSISFDFWAPFMSDTKRQGPVGELSGSHQSCDISVNFLGLLQRLK